MNSLANKSAVRDAILGALRDELALQSSAAALARDEATSEESRAQNKWDTHSQEAAYLAEGQARLVAEIEVSLEVYAALALPSLGPADPIVLGALVELDAGGKGAWYFLGPRSGGLEFTLEGRKVMILTSQSPLGGQLIGKKVGDTVRTTGRGPAAVQRIVKVA